MIYFIFWRILFILGLSHYWQLFLFFIALLILPQREYKPFIYAFIVVFILSFAPTTAPDYNKAELPQKTLGYLYHIEGQKADVFISGNKFKLKSYALRDFKEGDAVVLSGLAYRFQHTKNKYGFDYEKHYILQGYHGYLKAKIRLAEQAEPDSLFRRARAVFRRNLENCFNQLKPESKKLAYALILGDLSDKELTEKVSALGIIHLFVVSGFHFSAISLVLLFILKSLLKTPKYLTITFHLSLLIFYYGSIHSGYGSMRALFAIILSVLVFMLNRRNDTVNFTLIFVALVLFFQEEALYELGFQLTTIALIVVVITSRLLAEFNLSKTMKNLVLSLIVSLAVSPILVYARGASSLIAILLVPLLSPLIASFIIIIIVAVIFKKIFFFAPFVNAVEFLAKLIIDYIDWTNDLAFLQLSYHPYLALVLSVVVVFILTSIIYKNRGLKLHKMLFFAFILSAVLIINGMESGDNLHFYALYDGTACLYRTADMTILIDTSNDKELIAYLKKNAVSSIDYLIISKKDNYHAGNLALVKANFNIGEIIDTVDRQRIIEQGKTKLELYANNNSIDTYISNEKFKALLLVDNQYQANYPRDINILKLASGVKANQMNQFKRHFNAEKLIITGSFKTRKNRETLSEHDKGIYDTKIDGEVIVKSSGDSYEIKLLTD